MKNKDIISRVRVSLKEIGKDGLLTNKSLYIILRSSAIFLLKREVDNKNTIYNQMGIFSTICVDMIEVSATECLNVPNDCRVWRSKNKIPKFIESSQGFVYKAISSLDNSVQFFLTTPYIENLKSKIKFNKNKYVWLENDYLYSKNSYPILKIVGIFEEDMSSPQQDTNCSRLEDTFFLPDYLCDAAVKLTLQELSVFKQITYSNNEDKNINT